MRVADALIAASAVQSGAALMTANVRHYKCIPDITLEHFRPQGRDGTNSDVTALVPAPRTFRSATNCQVGRSGADATDLHRLTRNQQMLTCA